MEEKKSFKEILDTLIEDENSVQLTQEEQSTLDEVMGLLDGFDKNLKDLAQAREEGLTRDEWVEDTLRDSVRRIADNEDEENKFINGIGHAIDNELINQVTEGENEQTSTNQATEEAKQ